MKKIRKEIKFFIKDDGIVHMYDGLAKEHYKIGAEQKKWLESIDGTRNEQELKDIIPEKYFIEFMLYLEEYNLLEKRQSKIDRFKDINIFKIKLNLISGDSFLESIKPLSVLYRKGLFLLTPLLFTLAVVLLFNSREIIENFSLNIASFTVLNNLPFYIFIVFITGTLHELSHTLVAKSYSVSIPSLGVMLFYFMPSFFVDISGINFLNSKKRRIKILVAGIFMNISIFSILFILSIIFNLNSTYIYFAIFLNFMLVLINLIPYIEFDGYFIFINILENSQIKYSLLKQGSVQLHECIYSIVSMLFVLSIIFSTVNSIATFLDLSYFLIIIISFFIFGIYIRTNLKGLEK